MASTLLSRNNIEHGGSSSRNFLPFDFLVRGSSRSHSLRRIAGVRASTRRRGSKGTLGEKEKREENSSQTVGMTELVHQSLAALRLLHDALLVVLSDTAAELVVVHGGPILALAPEPRHPHRVLDLKDPLAAVQPTYTGTVDARTL